MKLKILKAAAVAFFILLVVGIMYGLTWFQVRNQSVVFYENVVRNLDLGRLAEALKGEEKTVEGRHVFSGGLQHIIETWKAPAAVPKPRVYDEALEAYRVLLEEKLTPEAGVDIFRRYFRIDLQYLGDILLRTGELYEERGEYTEALETYRTAESVFALDDDLQKKLEERTARLAARSGQADK